MSELENIDRNNITLNNIKYLETICNTDFYKNDREFISIIKKLTQQSAKISNKALSLANILNEAEKIKFDMMQKEIALGLSEDDKPYGISELKDVVNLSLVNIQNTTVKTNIKYFINLIESYFKLEDIKDKKSTLIEAKAYIKILRESHIEPMHLIINKERSKVWHMLESDFANSIKKLDIDLFIEKIRLTRIQHQTSVDEIYSYYQTKTKAITDLAIARKNDDNKGIETQNEILEKSLSANIEPLLIDTKKIVESLDLMIEEIPSELTSEQQSELKRFLPALSEYYIDQCHVVSGGNSYTTLNKNLSSLQKDINKGSSVGKLLVKIDKLEHTMQHLYLLHWIGESLLKEVFKCFSYKCSIGFLSRRYNEEKTQKPLLEIKKAIIIRNDIAHNALIWNPDKLTFAINIYREFIDIVAKEQDIKLNNFVIPPMNRELTKEQQEKKHQKYLAKHKIGFSSEELKELDKYLYEKLENVMIKSKWKLPSQEFDSYKKKFRELSFEKKHSEMDEYSRKIFNLSFEKLKGLLIEYARNNWDNFDEENKYNAIAIFTKLFYHQNDANAQEMIDKINNRIKSVKGSGGILSKLFK